MKAHHMMNRVLPTFPIRPRWNFARRGLPVLAVALLLAVTPGCGDESRQQGRFFEYETGRINLDRITYITPRIKVGVEEFPVTDAGIAKVVGHLREGRWSVFDVQAIILFDDFAWRAYRSKTFDKSENKLTDADIREIERELKRVQEIYKSIR